MAKVFSAAEVLAFQQAMNDLHKLSKGIKDASGPHYHSFLRTLVNSMQPMFGVASLLAAGGDLQAACRHTGATFRFALPEDQPAEVLNHVIALVHRAFYATFAMNIEAMCKGYCEARGGAVNPSKSPGILDYVNSALALSKLDDTRKKYWRAYFDAVRILRNKVAHYDSSFTDQEKQVLAAAGLSDHIGQNGQMQTTPANYVALVSKAYSFIKELDAN